jgi:hypothetical protein
LQYTILVLPGCSRSPTLARRCPAPGPAVEGGFPFLSEAPLTTYLAWVDIWVALVLGLAGLAFLRRDHVSRPSHSKVERPAGRAPSAAQAGQRPALPGVRCQFPLPLSGGRDQAGTVEIVERLRTRMGEWPYAGINRSGTGGRCRRV